MSLHCHIAQTIHHSYFIGLEQATDLGNYSTNLFDYLFIYSIAIYGESVLRQALCKVLGILVQQ